MNSVRRKAARGLRRLRSAIATHCRAFSTDTPASINMNKTTNVPFSHYREQPKRRECIVIATTQPPTIRPTRTTYLGAGAMPGIDTWPLPWPSLPCLFLKPTLVNHRITLLIICSLFPYPLRFILGLVSLSQPRPSSLAMEGASQQNISATRAFFFISCTAVAVAVAVGRFISKKSRLTCLHHPPVRTHSYTVSVQVKFNAFFFFFAFLLLPPVTASFIIPILLWRDGLRAIRRRPLSKCRLGGAPLRRGSPNCNAPPII